MARANVVVFLSCIAACFALQLQTFSKNEVNSLNKTAEVVVSSYCNDDHEWLADLDCDRVDIYVYSKCEDEKERELAEATIQAGSKCANFVHLDNIGREGETYLQHMISHYERLGQQHRKLVFLQGKSSKQEWLGGAKEVNELARSMDHAASSKLQNLGFASLHRASCSTLGPEQQVLVNLYKFYQQQSHFSHFVAPLRAEFVVSSERLHRVPKWLLSHTRHLLVSDPKARDTNATHTELRDNRGEVVERTWGMMFGCWSQTSNVEEPEKDFIHSSTFPMCFDACEDKKMCGPNANVPFEGLEGQDAPIGEEEFMQLMLKEFDGTDLATSKEHPCADFEIWPNQQHLEVAHTLQVDE